MSSLFLNTQTMFYSTLSLPKNTTSSEGFHIHRRHVCDNCPMRSPTLHTRPTRPVSPHNGHHPKMDIYSFSAPRGFFKLCYSCLFSPKGVAVQGVRAEGWGMELAALPQMERDAANPVFAFLMPHLPLCQLRFKYFTLFPICTYHCFLLDFQGEHSLAFEILSS